MKQKSGFNNIKPVLANGYRTEIPDDDADVILALDMFFGVSEPDQFLQELYRIAKPDGLLIIDNGHQSRKITLRKIKQSGLWHVIEENSDHIRCVPIEAGKTPVN